MVVQDRTLEIVTGAAVLPCTKRAGSGSVTMLARYQARQMQVEDARAAVKVFSWPVGDACGSDELEGHSDRVYIDVSIPALGNKACVCAAFMSAVCWDPHEISDRTMQYQAVPVQNLLSSEQSRNGTSGCTGDDRLYLAR